MSAAVERRCAQCGDPISPVTHAAIIAGDEIYHPACWPIHLAHCAATRANATQIGGEHYKSKRIEPWDYIAANDIGFFEGNAIKYLTRWRGKGGIDDLKKARHYIDKLIELEQEAKP